MADAADVQSLFLQVDASVELLRRNLAGGQQPMDQFEQRAVKMAMSVEKSIGTMGKNFGGFAQMAQSAAQQAEKSFNDSFSQIQRMAAKAITAPTVQGGGLNLGAAEARQAADAARQQAAAIGLIEKAAHSAAAGQGVMTQETRLYLQAASAARIEAERHATELQREAGALERLEIETRAAAAGQQLLVNGHRSAIVAGGQQRQSTMMLGQQVQDFAVQVVSGQSVVTAFSQQIGQAAFAVSGMGGRMEKVAAFLGSGWGAAVLVAVTVLAPLVSKMFEHNNALDEAVEKLRKDAAQTALTDRAHASFTNTLEGQIAAQKELNKEMERGLTSQAQQNRQNLDSSLKRQRDAEGALPGREKALTDAQARLQVAINSRPDVMSSGASSAYVARVAAARSEVERLTAERDAARDQVARTRQGVRDARITIATTDAKAAVDPIAAINKRYDDMADAARGAARGNDTLTASIRSQLTEIEKQRVAALKVEQDRQSAANRDRISTRNGSLTPNAVGGLLTGEFGGTVTSTTGGKHVNNSYHYRSQAVDFVPRGGVGAVSKDQIRAYLESQGVNIKELLGPGDKNHNDHFHVAFGKTARSGDEIARRTEAAQNAILSDQISFAEQERQARRRLLDAQGRSAATEEERDRLAREEVEADYQARATKISLQASKGDLKPSEAATLNAANEATRDQLLRNIRADRAKATLAAGFDDGAQDRQTKIAMLRIREDMATTAADRRAIQRELLELEQEERRQALEKIRQTSDDPAEVLRASNAIKGLPATEGAENAALAQRQAGPMEQYRNQLKLATSDMSGALEDVQVRGLENVQNGLAGIITGTQSVGGAFKHMANDIIADLARIAIQKLVLNAIGGGTGILSMFGLSGGGKVEGKAGGGKISGPGTGTSDSVWAMLGTKPIMLSNGESIVTAEATAKFWPVIDAMNKGRVKGLAQGGMVSGLPSMPSAPRLPSMTRFAATTNAPVQHFHVNAQGAILASGLVAEMRDIGVKSVIGGSGMAQQEIAERQSQALS